MAQADANLANITSKRWQHLLSSDSVSKQEADEKVVRHWPRKRRCLPQRPMWIASARSSLQENCRAIRRTVTARRTDVGDLIAANSESSPELFTVSDTTRMRLYVPVPEVDASGIKPGMKVTLNVPEFAGRTFEATLMGDAHAINQTSGSLLAQFMADNDDGALKPGDYAGCEAESAHQSAHGQRAGQRG